MGAKWFLLWVIIEWLDILMDRLRIDRVEREVSKASRGASRRNEGRSFFTLFLTLFGLYTNDSNSEGETARSWWINTPSYTLWGCRAPTPPLPGRLSCGGNSGWGCAGAPLSDAVPSGRSTRSLNKSNPHSFAYSRRRDITTTGLLFHNVCIILLAVSAILSCHSSTHF